MKVYSFDWEDDDPIFDFKLLGISSNVTRDCDLAFFLNKRFSFNFQRIKDQEIIEDKVIYSYSIYRFYHMETKQEVELVSNYSHPQVLASDSNSLFKNMESSKALISECKNYNFFIKSNFLLNEEFYVTLLNIEEIKIIEKINLKYINNLENLILPT